MVYTLWIRRHETLHRFSDTGQIFFPSPHGVHQKLEFFLANMLNRERASLSLLFNIILSQM